MKKAKKVKKTARVTAKATKKPRQKRRTKAEMLAARGITVDTDTDTPKRKRRTKEEMTVAHTTKLVEKAESDPIFRNNRENMKLDDLVTFIREKYEQHRGVRVCDRILQLVDEVEKLRKELVLLRSVVARG
jgi:hypothetical protein